jgi:hypothetical protein
MLPDLLILALAVLRISLIVTDEEFAFGLAAKMREKFGVLSHDAVGTIDVWNGEEVETLPVAYRKQVPTHLQPTVLARGISCVWCVSFWTGIGFAAIYFIHEPTALVIAFPLALSQLAIFGSHYLWK